MANDQHVTFRNDGRWQVKGEHNSRATAVFGTKLEAVEKAREIAKNNKVELFIHGRDGKIQERNTYGRDPYPPRG